MSKTLWSWAAALALMSGTASARVRDTPSDRPPVGEFVPGAEPTLPRGLFGRLQALEALRGLQAGRPDLDALPRHAPRGEPHPPRPGYHAPSLYSCRG